MGIELTNKLNRLLQSDHAGKLYFSFWLKRNGYSDQLVKKYRDSGWLSCLSKGIMYRAGGKLNSFAALASYNEQMGKDYYIGAHSALELAGFNHYVPMGKPLLMVGHPHKEPVPEWLRVSDFEKEMKFFSTEIFSKPQLCTYNVNGIELQASTPEQAFMECLLLAPKQYAYMDLFYIMEQLTTLRPEILQILLESSNNIKVKRMFLFMAKKAGQYWFDSLETKKIDLGSAKYQLTDRGVYVAEYRITVPRELNDYE